VAKARRSESRLSKIPFAAGRSWRLVCRSARWTRHGHRFPAPAGDPRRDPERQARPGDGRPRRGFVQANLAALPREQAYDFLLFASSTRAPARCSRSRTRLARAPGRRAGATCARTSRYGSTRTASSPTRSPTPPPTWRGDLVAFLIAARSPSSGRCSTRDSPLATWSTEDVACGKRRPSAGGGPLHGPMVVSMRPIRSGDVARAVTVTARFPSAHGGAGPRRRPGRPRHRDLAGPLGRPAAGRAGQVPVFLGLRRHAAGGGARVEAAVHDHP